MLFRSASTSVQQVYDDITLEQGYAVDGPYLTWIANAASGTPGALTTPKFTGLDWQFISPIGDWDTTNARFWWDYSNSSTPSWNGGVSGLTLDELRMEHTGGGEAQFIHLKMAANSDGATQQYLGELNSYAAISGAGIPVVVQPPRIVI